MPQPSDNAILDVHSTFEWDSWRNLVAIGVIIVVGSLANSAGVGGGAIFIPVLQALVGFGLKDATAVSQALITAGSLVSVCINIFHRSPLNPDKPLINFNAALALTPVVLTGVAIGVLLNTVLPAGIITVLLILLMLIMVVQTTSKAIKMYKRETREQRAAAQRAEQEVVLSAIVKSMIHDHRPQSTPALAQLHPSSWQRFHAAGLPRNQPAQEPAGFAHFRSLPDDAFMSLSCLEGEQTYPETQHIQPFPQETITHKQAGVGMPPRPPSKQKPTETGLVASGQQRNASFGSGRLSDDGRWQSHDAMEGAMPTVSAKPTPPRPIDQQRFSSTGSLRRLFARPPGVETNLQTPLLSQQHHAEGEHEEESNGEATTAGIVSPFASHAGARRLESVAEHNAVSILVPEALTSRFVHIQPRLPPPAADSWMARRSRWRTHLLHGAYEVGEMGGVPVQPLSLLQRASSRRLSSAASLHLTPAAEARIQEGIRDATVKGSTAAKQAAQHGDLDRLDQGLGQGLEQVPGIKTDAVVRQAQGELPTTPEAGQPAGLLQTPGRPTLAVKQPPLMRRLPPVQPPLPQDVAQDILDRLDPEPLISLPQASIAAAPASFFEWPPRAREEHAGTEISTEAAPLARHSRTTAFGEVLPRRTPSYTELQSVAEKEHEQQHLRQRRPIIAQVSTDMLQAQEQAEPVASPAAVQPETVLEHAPPKGFQRFKILAEDMLAVMASDLAVLPYKTLAAMASTWVIFSGLQVARSLVQKCSPAYWALLTIQLSIMLCISLVSSLLPKLRSKAKPTKQGLHPSQPLDGSRNNGRGANDKPISHADTNGTVEYGDSNSDNLETVVVVPTNQQAGNGSLVNKLDVGSITSFEDGSIDTASVNGNGNGKAHDSRTGSPLPSVNGNQKGKQKAIRGSKRTLSAPATVVPSPAKSNVTRPAEPPSILGTSLTSALVTLSIGCVAGLVGGMLGLGGGMLIGPLLLELGVHPQISTATSSLMVLFSSSAALVGFVVLGRINAQFGGILGGASGLASILGVVVVSDLVRRSGRTSMVVFSLAFVMIVALGCVAGFGITQLVKDVKAGEGMDLNPLCQ